MQIIQEIIQFIKGYKMAVLLNTEYLLKASYIIPKNPTHPEFRCINIFDSNGKRFYAASDNSMLIEFNEAIVGEQMPVKNIMIQKPNLTRLGTAKDKYTSLVSNYDNLYQKFFSVETNSLIPIVLENDNKKIETNILKGTFPSYLNTLTKIQNQGDFTSNIYAYESMMDKKQLEIIENRLKIKREALLFSLTKDIIYCMYRTNNMIFLAANFR